MDFVTVKSMNMRYTLRYMLGKSPDLGARSGVLRRMFHDIGAKSRNMIARSDDMVAKPGDMITMSDNMDTLSGDLSTMPCDLYLMPSDMESMSDNFAAMSLASLLKSLNPIAWLYGMAAMLRYEISEWYYRKMGLSDPAFRKYVREADFDDLFVRVSVDDYVLPYGRFHKKWKPMPPVVHELLYFLVVDKPVRRDPNMLLAVLLAFARHVLGLTERTAVRTLPRLLVLPNGSGRGPLGARPPTGLIYT